MLTKAQIGLRKLSNGVVVIFSINPEEPDIYNHASQVHTKEGKSESEIEVGFVPFGMPLYAECNSEVSKSGLDSMVVFDYIKNYDRIKNTASKGLIDSIIETFIQYVEQEDHGLIVPNGGSKLII